MKEMPYPLFVIITGASAGLGAALARAYAFPGRTLGLIARDAARLEAVATECRARGADVYSATIDVTDGPAVAAWMAKMAVLQRVDLVIANAGVFTGRGPSSLETVGDISWLVRTNIEGTANVVQPAIAAMRANHKAHIAIIGSLAALQPLADAPGYSASKAGVMAYGEALREYLVPHRMRLTLVYPGHIDTAQVAGHVGALPLLMTAAEAASRIKRGLDAKKTFIAFPWQLLWLIRLGRLLPWRLRAIAGRDFRFYVRRG